MSLDVKALELAIDMLNNHQKSIESINMRLKRLEIIVDELKHDAMSEHALKNYHKIVIDEWNKEMQGTTPIEQFDPIADSWT